MNKNIYRTGLLLSAALMLSLVACNRILDEVDPVNEEKGADVEVLTLFSESETKATLGNEVVNPTKAWEDGDMIAVWAGTSAISGQFQNCAVEKNTVSVNLYSGIYQRYNYAVYPYKHSETGEVVPSYNAGTSVLTINLPSSYAAAAVTGTKNPVPMVAVNSSESSSLTFYTVGALVRISMSGLPSKATKLIVSFDKTVTGSFTVQGLDTSAPHIDIASNAPSTVTINITPGDLVDAINIPVPLGNVNVISVAAYENETLLFEESSVIADWVAQRAHGKKVMLTPRKRSIGSMIIAPGNLYTDESGNLHIAENYYTHTYVLSGAVDSNSDGIADDVTVNSFGVDGNYSINNRTHFLWNEIFYLFRKPTEDPLSWAMVSANDAFGVTDTPSSYPMTKNDFGDGFTWHVPTYENSAYIYGRDVYQRPGAIVNGYRGWKYMKVLVTDMQTAEKKPLGTTKLLNDYTWSGDGKTYSEFAYYTTGDNMGPSTTLQAGVVFFPDNVEISGATFTSDVPIESVGNNSTLFFNQTKITKANLDLLIAQGCAFLPALGHWSPRLNGAGTAPVRMNGNGVMSFYITDKQSNNSSGYFEHEYDGIAEFGSYYNSAGISVDWKYDFDTVRLVRDIPTPVPVEE